MKTEQFYKIATSRTIKELLENFHDVAKKRFKQNVDIFSIAYEGVMNNESYLFYYAYEGETFQIMKHKLSDESRPGVVCYKYKKEKIIQFNNYKVEYAGKMEQYAFRKEAPKPEKGESYNSHLFYRVESPTNDDLGIISLQSKELNRFQDKSTIEWIEEVSFYIGIALEQIKHRREKNRNFHDALPKISEYLISISKERENGNIKKGSIVDKIEYLMNILKGLCEYSVEQTYAFGLIEGEGKLTLYVEEASTDVPEDDDKVIILKRTKERTIFQMPYKLEGEKNPGSWSIHNKKPVFINDLEKDYKAYPGLDKDTEKTGSDTQSIMYYPLLNEENEVLGVLTIQSKEKYAYSEYDFGLFAISANFFQTAYIGIMENADLMKQNEHIMRENIQYLISEKFRFQLDNHFTKNALLKVGNIIDRKHEEYKYFLQFQKLFDDLVEASKKKEGISIKEDIQFLKNFVSMNNVLYPTIEFEYSCDENLMEEKIPPLILQPFVENSIIHGIKPIGNGKITINYKESTIANLGRILECIIIDNGQGREAAEKKKKEREKDERELGAPSESKNTSIGISSTIDLLRHLNPEIEDPVQILDLKDGNIPKGTKVTVKILLSRKQEL